MVLRAGLTTAYVRRVRYVGGLADHSNIRAKSAISRAQGKVWQAAAWRRLAVPKSEKRERVGGMGLQALARALPLPGWDLPAGVSS